MKSQKVCIVYRSINHVFKKMHQQAKWLIREFQIAVKILDPDKSPREAIRCCGMLSTCFLEKRMPHSAMRWCEFRRLK